MGSKKKFTVGSVCADTPSKKLLTIDENASLEDALAVMDKHSVQSLPVTNKKRSVVGCINTIDVLTRVVFDKVFAMDDVTQEQLQKIAKENTDLLKKIKVHDSMGLSLESKSTWIVKHSDDIGILLNAMCSGVHRTLVEMPENDHMGADEPEQSLPEKVTLLENFDFISQRDVCRFLATHYKKHEATEAVLARHVKEVAVSEGVTCVLKGQPVLQTFKQMLLQQETVAVPIVDAKGKLFDTVSASDIRKLRAANIEALLLPNEKYVNQTRGNKAEKRKPVTCRATDTVASVLSLLLASRVHRAWVLDDEGRPVGALSYSDILRAIFLCSAPGPDQASNGL